MTRLQNRVGGMCPKGMPPRARALGMPPGHALGSKKGGGHRGAWMTGENRQLVTSEPVEFEK